MPKQVVSPYLNVQRMAPLSDWGPSRAFSGRGICHFLRRDIGKLGFKIAGNGIRYSHSTGNVLVFLLGKREKYDFVTGNRDPIPPPGGPLNGTSKVRRNY